MAKKKHQGALKRQIIAGCAVFVALLCLIMSIVSFTVYRKSMLDQFETQIASIIYMTEAQIDTDDLEQCIETGAASEKFDEMLRYIDDARLYYGLDYIVLDTPVKTDDGFDVIMVASGLLADERAGLVDNGIPIPHLGDMIGSAFTPDFIEQTYDEMNNETEIRFSTTQNDYGNSYGGAISLRNSDGKGIAILSAGVSTASIDNAMRNYILLIALCAVALGIIFLIFMNLWIRKRVLRPIQAIENAANEFAQKSHGQKDPSALVLNMPEINSGNELEDLADTLVSMSNDMKDYVEDIVFSEQEILRIRGIALNDALTGVRNKTAFNSMEDELNKEIENGTAEFGVLMIDLNSLKKVNDNYGHDKGDIYIKKSRTFICDIFAHSPVFRIGGDEFVVILKDRDLENADELLQKFNDEMQRMQTDPSLKEWERVWAAVGMAVYDSSNDTDVPGVLSRADREMYERKREMKSEEKG